MGTELVVYIAGPMTGYPEFNYPAFVGAAARWRELGYKVLAPNENFNGDTSQPYREYIRLDLQMLLDGNAIALLPGWEKSRGARFELHVAQLLGHEIFDAITFERIDPATVVTTFLPDEKESILAEAERIVNGARQQAYGHPLDDFTKTAKLWSAIFGVEVTAEQVALGMIMVKASRLLNTPEHRDSMVDVAGYIKTYQMVVAERKRRAAQ